MKNFYFLIGLLVCFSCSRQKIDDKYFYYPKGGLWKMIHFTNGNDTTSYQITEFMQSGDTLIVLNFKDSKKDGYYKSFHPNNKIEAEGYYKEGRLHGITNLFDKNSQQPSTQNLYINGINIISIPSGVIEDTLYISSYYYPDKSEINAFTHVGSLTWDSKGEIIELFCSYFKVDAKSEIKKGEPLEISIKFIMGLYQDINFELELGELNDKLNFVDSSNVVVYKSNGRDLLLNFKNYNLGHNLLLGKIKLFTSGASGPITLYKNPDYNEYIFFHQFEVIK